MLSVGFLTVPLYLLSSVDVIVERMRNNNLLAHFLLPISPPPLPKTATHGFNFA